MAHNRKRQGQQGFTLVELMVAVAVLLGGVIAVAKLIPAAILLNSENRADSGSLVFAQREMAQFVGQPLTAATFTDQQGNACMLGGAPFNTVVGNPVITVGSHAAISFAGAQVAGYGYYYTDAERTSGSSYDVRWAVVSNGNPAGNVTSRRFLLGVRKMGGNAAFLPVTLDTTVEK